MGRWPKCVVCSEESQRLTEVNTCHECDRKGRILAAKMAYDEVLDYSADEEELPPPPVDMIATERDRKARKQGVIQ